MTAFPLTIELRYTGRRLLRPPKAELLFSARVQNLGAEELWIVLPDDLTDGAPPGSSIGSLERYELDPGPLQVLHGLGTGGFFALAVPGGGVRELSGLPMAFWGTVPERVSLVVTCASHLSVNGRPVQEELAVELGGRDGGPVDASPLADQRAVVQAIEAPPEAAVAIVFSDTATHSLAVALS